MCVIVVALDKKPDYNTIKKCYDDNSHGCSITWFNDKGLAEYQKGLNEDELFKLVYETPLPFVLHFRQSSFFMDRDNKFLNHPFEITPESPLRMHGEAEKLLIHNGTLKEYELMMAVADVPFVKDDPDMTDTRAIAKMMAKNNDRLPWRLEGKFVIVDSARKRFRLAGNFITEDGMLFSNLSWKWKQTYYSKKGKFNLTDEEYYNYLNGKDIDGNDINLVNPNDNLDPEKKKIVKTPVEETCKKTQKIKIRCTKPDTTCFKLEEKMTELQYNSGRLYRYPKSKNTVDGDVFGNISEYMRAGMKERRKWWKGFYDGNLYWKQRARSYNKTSTIYKCCDCGNLIDNGRYNILNIIGRKQSEFNCLACDQLKKNSQSLLQIGKRIDNFKEKTTRLLSYEHSEGCCSV